MSGALIVGVAGFVGDYLAERLLSEGYGVCATKLRSETYARENVTVSDLDILDVDGISEALDRMRPDFIFHLAAQSSVPASWKNPQLTVEINIKGTVNLLETVKSAAVKPRVILIGSGEEYGFSFNERRPVSEDACPKPANIYAVTKAAQNMMGALYSKSYGMDIISVRAFNHIGAKQSPQFVVSDFCKQVAEIEKGLREPVIYVGNLSAKRDFTDVRDIVGAYAAIAERGKTGETYNVGSGKSVSVQYVLDYLLSLSTADIRVVVDENKLRPSDIPVVEADIQKIAAIGWKPEIGLETSLGDILEYWRGIVS
jgi:GDP-4-dehydro-6-deoxy-D-mannose reductase